jgi:hypothetical protein
LLGDHRTLILDKSGISANYPDTSMAHYEFSPSGVDLSFNGRDGSTEGGAIYAPSRVQGGLTIPDSSGNGLFNIPSGAFHGVFDFTVVTWCKLNNYGTAGSTYRGLLTVDNPSNYEIGLTYVTNAPNQDQWLYYIKNAPGAYYSADAGFNNGSYHHIAFTRSGTNLHYYRNGSFIETAAGVSSVTISGIGSSYIGTQLKLAGRGWDGQIDDFRFYGRALTGSEIRSLYNGGYV